MSPALGAAESRPISRNTIATTASSSTPATTPRMIVTRLIPPEVGGGVLPGSDVGSGTVVIVVSSVACQCSVDGDGEGAADVLAVVADDGDGYFVLMPRLHG